MEVNKIYLGKMEIVLKDFPDNCCDSIVTDPPYGISFMGKRWDYNVPSVEQWIEAIRVLKPGGYMLCACGTRTQHRMVVNIEDAGFEIRDVISWIYGSGFPKSLNIALAIDKKNGYIGDRGKAFVTAGAGERKDIQNTSGAEAGTMTYSNAISDEAKQYEGYGTALKPATEFWTLCRKPISEKTVAENVLKWGTGGLNIDGCRIDFSDNEPDARVGTDKISKGASKAPFETGLSDFNNPMYKQGRFPANVILDEFMGEELDRQSGYLKSGTGAIRNNSTTIEQKFKGINPQGLEISYEDEGGASRFFYCPKPDNFERNKGLKNFSLGEPPASARSKPAEGRENALGRPRQNHHTTVKPLDLMRYLVRLVTPKKGICLDPFCGSGTTLAAAKMELMNYVGIDIDESYISLAEARVKLWNPDLYKPQELF